MATKQFKVIVLGSGQGGTPLTMALAAAGHTIALVESSHIGKSHFSYLHPYSTGVMHDCHCNVERIVFYAWERCFLCLGLMILFRSWSIQFSALLTIIRWHMHRRGLHPDQDHGGISQSRLLRSPLGRMRRQIYRER